METKYVIKLNNLEEELLKKRKEKQNFLKKCNFLENENLDTSINTLNFKLASKLALAELEKKKKEEI